MIHPPAVYMHFTLLFRFRNHFGSTTGRTIAMICFIQTTFSVVFIKKLKYTAMKLNRVIPYA